MLDILNHLLHIFHNLLIFSHIQYYGILQHTLNLFLVNYSIKDINFSFIMVIFLILIYFINIIILNLKII